MDTTVHFSQGPAGRFEEVNDRYVTNDTEHSRFISNVLK